MQLLRAGGTVLVETDVAAEVCWPRHCPVAHHRRCRHATPLGLRHTDGYRGDRSFIELTASEAAVAVLAAAAG